MEQEFEINFWDFKINFSKKSLAIEKKYIILQLERAKFSKLKLELKRGRKSRFEAFVGKVLTLVRLTILEELILSLFKNLRIFVGKIFNDKTKMLFLVGLLIIVLGFISQVELYTKSLTILSTVAIYFITIVMIIVATKKARKKIIEYRNNYLMQNSVDLKRKFIVLWNDSKFTLSFGLFALTLYYTFFNLNLDSITISVIVNGIVRDLMVLLVVTIVCFSLVYIKSIKDAGLDIPLGRDSTNNSMIKLID